MHITVVVGGGNGGGGGIGGDQWTPAKTIVENVGGSGGKALSNSSTLNKLYLGGSGGRGHANDLDEYAAGNGGGIIIITASSIQSNGYLIKSNGGNAVEPVSAAKSYDGLSGGGAGGTILLNINNIATPLNLQSTGGKGGDQLSVENRLGSGAGAGGGLIAISQGSKPSNLNYNLNGGLNGVNTAFGNDPHGATPGSDGVFLTGFNAKFSKTPFQKSIDSIKITQALLHDCKIVDFKGAGYPQPTSVTSWIWNLGDGNTGNSQNLSHTYTASGNFKVSLNGMDINGCKDSATTTVAINDINLTKSKDTALCGSSSVKIFASGGTSYSWTPATSLSNASIENPVVTPLSSTKYFVTVTNPDGCSKEDSVNIIVNSLPLISKSNDTIICKNSRAPHLASGGTTYTWSPASSLNNPNIANPVASPATTTTYNVKVTNVDDCSQTASINVNIKPVPIITKSNDTTICNKASAKIFVTGGNSYSWTPTSTLNNSASPNPIATPTSTTVYHVKITDVNSCVFNDSIKINVRPAAVFSISPDNSVCARNSQQLSASGGDTYLWGPASFLDNPNVSNPIASPNKRQPIP